MEARVECEPGRAIIRAPLPAVTDQLALVEGAGEASWSWP